MSLNMQLTRTCSGRKACNTSSSITDTCGAVVGAMLLPSGCASCCKGLHKQCCDSLGYCLRGSNRALASAWDLMLHTVMAIPVEGLQSECRLAA